jgi:hypothetical protein
MSQVLATSTSLVQEKADHSAVYILAVDRAKESPSLKVENHGDRYMEAKRSRVGRQLKRWMTTRLARESTTVRACKPGRVEEDKREQRNP